MSRIGKKIITLPAGVEARIAGQIFSVSGPKGKIELTVHPKVQVSVVNDQVKVSTANPGERQSRALWGTMWSLINNMVIGVHKGYEKKLELVGVGYRVQADKEKITLQLGFSHPVVLQIPAGLEVKVEKNNMTISGNDKHKVGQFSAIVRSQRKPEPYKGKGIKYSDEIVRRKAGKVVKAVGG